MEQVWHNIQAKTEQMAKQLRGTSPHVAKQDGLYDDMPTDWWTSGFWPGLLWIMYDMTGKELYREGAWPYDESIEQWMLKPSQELHHDVGFQFLPTAVIKYHITGDSEGRRRGLSAANFLAGRFNLAGRFIRAWNHDHIGWSIIDSCMNLSLLFWASRESGDPRFEQIAIAHADTLTDHFIRPDGSVHHVVSFNPHTGEVIESLGGQGFGPNSAWSRGQAWAIYGMANTYRYTGDIKYLQAARRAAHHFLSCLPADHVPHWDFRTDSLEGEPRDSSAAAIAASGLLEIAEHLPQQEARLYAEAAHTILESLTENYATWDQPEHQAILLHGTGHKPINSNVDVSLIYGDYYYVEAFAKLVGWKRRIF